MEQKLETIQKIGDEKDKGIILDIISDKYQRQILNSIKVKSKSAIEINKETGIPISTVYRRIQILADNHLVTVWGIISDEGKKLFLYKSKIKEIQTQFLDGAIEIKIILS